MHFYIITTGDILRGVDLRSARRLWTGYSGHEAGKNNPGMQNVAGVGPIPCGNYTFEGPPFRSDKTGPCVLRIVPKPGTETFGRTDFELHGDSIENPGQASHGCIVHSPKAGRQEIWDSGDHDLQVIAYPLELAGDPAEAPTVFAMDTDE